MENESEVKRIEAIWQGDFGNKYVERNQDVYKGRKPFWDKIFSQLQIKSALEIGCNVGGNLYWISKLLPARQVFGVDVNETALQQVRENIPGVNTVWSPARSLPFRDYSFDLVFTTGVLIHQTPESLPIIMNEIVRCSKKYVLCGEYYADQLTEVPYRGLDRALWKQDFGGTYLQLFPELELIEKGRLTEEDGGWDDLTYWIMEKR